MTDYHCGCINFQTNTGQAQEIGFEILHMKKLIPLQRNPLTVFRNQ